MDDPYYVLESKNTGYKVVYCLNGKPQGGRGDGNYTIVADGLKREEADELVKQLRNN